MRIRATGTETDIQLDAQERKSLRKALSVLTTLAKHSGGEAELKAAEALLPVADKWGKEPSDAS